MLCDEVVAHLAHKEERHNAEALIESALAPGGTIPDQGHMDDASLSPTLGLHTKAYDNQCMSQAASRHRYTYPAHTLLPKRFKRGRRHLIGDDVHVVRGVLSQPV